MTGDELAARLYAERGYLVMSSELELPLGDICEEAELVRDRERMRTMLRIVGQSNPAEYHQQQLRAAEICEEHGISANRMPCLDPYFYRVEAAD